MVKLKRAYEPAARSDGYRVLVDGLWPRGVAKQALALDAWDCELAPSGELRTWFAHDPAKWSEFQSRYRRELQSGAAPARLRELATRAAAGTVTLVYAAHDPEHNNAVVLRAAIARRAPRRAATSSKR